MGESFDDAADGGLSSAGSVEILPKSKRPRKSARWLILLTGVLAIALAGLLAYLGPCRGRPPAAWLWPVSDRATPAVASLRSRQPTPTVQFQLPSASTIVPNEPGEAQPTPRVGKYTIAPDLESIAAGPLVPATDHMSLARLFDEEQALEHLSYLTDDERGGRQPGTPGGRSASDYISARFAEYGLQPAGPDATYFQTFTVPYGRITTLPVLTIIPPTGDQLTHTYAYRTDYRALTGGYVGAGEAEGPVVWLNECTHDDYTGLDMVGKIAMCRYTRSPEIYRQAIEHQVGGLLLLDRDREGDTFRRGGYRETAWVPQTIPAYLISEAVAKDLLIGTDYTLDDLSIRFTATPLSTTVRMAVTTEEREEVKARNVLGLLPGSDPAHSDEVVVIGAHYDHLGLEPDGAVMNGANDNSSGVAVMLELARLWQEHAVRPARSVLFAAWDGEEVGLVGSRYYVQNPSYPLTRTVAMLNLDMVSAGEELLIDGEGAVVDQLQASATAFGITVTHSSVGRSDHVPFQEAGVSAAMLIYWPDPFYHTPDDEIQVIGPEKIKAVGVLSAHTLASLAEGHIELEQAVERLRASIATGDREAFLEGLDPTDPDLYTAQAAWFDNLWSRELTEVSIEPGRVRIGEDEADITLKLTYRWADEAQGEPAGGPENPSHSSASYDVRFVQRDGSWYFAGHKLDVLAGDVVTVARFPDVAVGIQKLLSTTQDAYLSFIADLDLEPITGTRFIFYPDATTMRAIVRPAPSPSQGGEWGGWLVPSARLAEIAWGQAITPALANLALSQMGLPPGEAPWLREGLALYYEDGTEGRYLATLSSADVVPALPDFPALDNMPEPEARPLRAQAWSLTEYLIERYGSAGLRALCAAWGRTGDADAAFRQALGLSPAGFQAAWRTDRLEPLRADAEAIQSTVAARAEAVLDGDEAGFMATVNPADPVLRTEERNWFADLTDHPVLSYTATGQIVGWVPNGEEAVVALSVNAAISGRQSSHVTYDARFMRKGERWFYAGVAWNMLASDHFLLKYQDHDEAWARHVLDLAEAAYAQVTTDLGVTEPLSQEIKVYNDGELFRSSIFLSMPDWASGWTEPGEAIKLRLREDSDHTLQRVIAHELTHQVLFAQGLSSTPAGGTEGGWLHEGVANFEAGRVLPLGNHWMAGKYLPIVQEAVRRHNEFPLDDFPTWENIAQDQVELFYAQSWSVISYIVERYGLPGLRRFIATSVESQPTGDTAANLRAALDVDLESFQAGWREYIYAGGVPGGLTSLAQQFEAERALAHISTLSSPEFGGREAGTLGAELTAAYIANQFVALGLEPLGDPLTGTEMTRSETAHSEGSEGLPRGYLQWFPISHTHLISIPTLALMDADGAVLHEFTYRQDFLERAGEGTVEGELVWIRTGSNLEGLRFGGAVVLERSVRDPIARAEQLQAHGAGGLVIATDREPSEVWQTSEGSTYIAPGSKAPIPVFEITGAAFETLLERVGTEYRDLITAPPVLPLGVRMRQALTRSPVTTTLTANVLALLPGRDPRLADEVLLVGAHYDHIGQSPDGLYFPGANRNASGVAAMLEMAQVWQSAGYRPARSVLFAAWGAEELDGAGVAHYMTHPAIPLTRTVGVIALESIAGGKGYKLLFYGTREQDLALIQRLEASAAQLDRRAWRRGSTGEGWHARFNSAGIPTLKLMWDGAERDFYLPTDTADRIDPERLAASGEILTLTTAWLADR